MIHSAPFKPMKGTQVMPLTKEQHNSFITIQQKRLVCQSRNQKRTNRDTIPNHQITLRPKFALPFQKKKEETTYAQGESYKIISE